MYLFNIIIFIFLSNMSSLFATIYLGTAQPFAHARDLRATLQEVEFVDGTLFICMTDDLADKILATKSGSDKVYIKLEGNVGEFWTATPAERISGLIYGLANASKLVSFQINMAKKLVSYFPKDQESHSNNSHFFNLDFEVLKEIIALEAIHLGKDLPFRNASTLKEALKNIKNIKKNLVIFMTNNLFKDMFIKDGKDRNNKSYIRLRPNIKDFITRGSKNRATLLFQDNEKSIVSFRQEVAKNLLNFLQNNRVENNSQKSSLGPELSEAQPKPHVSEPSCDHQARLPHSLNDQPETSNANDIVIVDAKIIKILSLDAIHLGKDLPFSKANTLKEALKNIKNIEKNLVIFMTNNLLENMFNKVASRNNKGGIRLKENIKNFTTKGKRNRAALLFQDKEISIVSFRQEVAKNLLDFLQNSSQRSSLASDFSLAATQPCVSESSSAHQVTPPYSSQQPDPLIANDIFDVNAKMIEILSLDAIHLGKDLLFCEAITLKEALKKIKNIKKNLVIFMNDNLFKEMFCDAKLYKSNKAWVGLKINIRDFKIGGPRCKATLLFQYDNMNIVSFGKIAANNLLDFLRDKGSSGNSPKLSHSVSQAASDAPLFAVPVEKEPTTFKYTAIDLFCGCGGTSYGFKEAGFNILAGIDFDEQALEAYANNFPEALCYRENIAEIDPQCVLDDLQLQPGELGCLLASPPCQPFSNANSKEKDDDERRNSYIYVIEFVKIFKPRCIFIENVTGQLRKNGNNFPTLAKENITPSFEEMGYTVNTRILDASEYGVPQLRKRYILIAHCCKNEFQWPIPFDSTISVEEALSDLSLIKPEEIKAHDVPLLYGEVQALSPYQEKMRHNSPHLTLHFTTHLKDKHFEFINLVRKQMEEKGPNYIMKKNGRRAYRILRWDRPSQAVTCYPDCIGSDTGIIHPLHDRKLSPRELARLQGFPDTYIFIGGLTQSYKQIGNAVPPPLALALALQIIEVNERMGKERKRDIFVGEADEASPHKKQKTATLDL